jgi:hypothetical protein
MKYAAEMGSSAMMYVHAEFHKDWSRHSKLDKRDTQTHRQEGAIGMQGEEGL